MGQPVYKVQNCAAAAAQSESSLLLAVVYVTEARPVKGWSPDKERD